MAGKKIKRFTQTYLFRNIETIFLIFLIFILVGGMTVYFSYGFTRANSEMHSLVPTSQNEYLYQFMSRMENKLFEIQKHVPDNNKVKPLEFKMYRIKRGDTLSKIAAANGVTFDTLISVNKIQDARSISIGTTILIPNQPGVYYQVKRRDSMTKIAKYFSGLPGVKKTIAEETIELINDLDSRDVLAGETIFIPGGELTRNQREKVMGLEYAVPVVGLVVSGVGYRMDPFHGTWSFHPGVDIAAPYGTPIYAGKSGKITIAGWYGGYGLCVIIQHGNGYETRYGHMQKIYVKPGMYVSRNKLIGRVGSTGRSLGPHLHFEVRHRDRIINPFRYHGLNRRMWWR